MATEITLTSVKLRAEHLRRCSRSEQAVWGTLAFMARGDWQTYGVMPPRSLSTAPYDVATTAEVASALGITEDRLGELLAGLEEKGTLAWR